MTASLDYYEVLQVSPNADAEVIQAAYRRLAMKWHPDKNPGDSQAANTMKQLNAAYEVLADPQKRREYDSRRRQSTMGGRTRNETPKSEPTPPNTPPVSDSDWRKAIPDATAIYIAGGVLFLIGHFGILSGNSPAGPLAFLLTCFVWGVLFGAPAYLSFQAKKRTAASVVAMLFLLAAGLDVGVVVAAL